MQIELIGCTSAGKSTLARHILRSCREQGIDAQMGDEFVLGQARLNWVQGKLVRTLLVDLISLVAFLVTWRDHTGFYRFAIRLILALPAAVASFERLNIARNTFKNTAIYEIIRRRASERQVVLLDEGTLHSAHYLFVHVSVPPRVEDLSTFVSLVPLPDLVLNVTQSESVLVERTLKRGHKRIPGCAYSDVELFVRRAMEVFHSLGQQPALESRLVVVDGRQDGHVGQAITALWDRLPQSAQPAAYVQKGDATEAKVAG